MKKKYTMTLLEIMIVIFIIGIIGSVIGYNMRGSLDNGKAFKTKEGSKKLYEIVQLETAQNTTLIHNDVLPETVAKILRESGLVKNVKDLMKDGWGHEYCFDLKDGELRFYSEKYNDFCKKKGIEQEYPWEDDNDRSH